MNEVLNLIGLFFEVKNVNEYLFKVISDIFRFIFKLMKLFGIYYGDNILKFLIDDFGCLLRRVYVLFMYCGLVVIGFWFNFFLVFFSCFFVFERIYVFLMFCLWCFMGVLNVIIILIVLLVIRIRKLCF